MKTRLVCLTLPGLLVLSSLFAAEGDRVLTYADSLARTESGMPMEGSLAATEAGEVRSRLETSGAARQHTDVTSNAESLPNVTPSVTNVRARQRAGTKLVDIYYDLADPDSASLSVNILVSQDAGATWTLPAITFSGAYGDGVSSGVNKYVVWNAGADWDGKYVSKCRVRVIANDGRRIGCDKVVFVSNRTGNWDVFTVAVDGASLANLTSNPADDRTPAVSPGGDRIAFVSARDGNDEIYVMDPNGENPKRLTNDAGQDGTPVWSPDGQKIAFVSKRSGTWQIYVMNGDGTGLKRLTNNSSNDAQPCWSPDGRKIVFMSDRDGNKEVYLMNTDGSNEVNLTRSVRDDNTPYFSPNGSLIAFISDRDGDYDLWTIDSNGGNPSRITTGATDHVGWFSWSPDGGRIVFDSKADGYYHVYIVQADGSASRQLTKGAFNDRFSSWTCDGRWIVFASDRDGGDEIYTMDSNGGDQVNLSHDAGHQNLLPSPSSVYQEGGGCFIATAAFGSYLDPHVRVLRTFRDRHLLTNPLGRCAVAVYYRTSPPIAAYIARHRLVKSGVRWLLTPVVYGVKYPWTALALISAPVLPVGLTIRKRLTRKSGASCQYSFSEFHPRSSHHETGAGQAVRSESVAKAPTCASGHHGLGRILWSAVLLLSCLHASAATGEALSPPFALNTRAAAADGSMFQIGRRVISFPRPGVDGIYVRTAPPELARVPGSDMAYDQSPGVHGTITSGPFIGSVDGFTGNWWQIRWDAGLNGWCAESVIAFAPLAGDMPQPDFSSRDYRADNIFWKAGNAPASTGPPDSKLGSALGNCTWYAHGRMRELGFDPVQLDTLNHDATQWAAQAKANRIQVDSVPSVGSIAQSVDQKHVAVVESLNVDGTITVTESSFIGLNPSPYSPWNFLWRHRTVSRTWFDKFIRPSQSPPRIVQQPTSRQAVQPGSMVHFAVTAAGPPPLSYQWSFNAQEISSANGATLTLTSVSAANSGVYSVVVWNTHGFVVSDSASLAVLADGANGTPPAWESSQPLPPVGPGKDSLVFITHGRAESDAPDEHGWVDEMKRAVEDRLPFDSNWMVIGYKWPSRRSVWTVLDIAEVVGTCTGARILDLAQSTPNHRWEHIHFIGHSAGAALIEAASKVVAEGPLPRPTIHTTFLDAYVGTSRRQEYGRHSDWADSYFAVDWNTGDPIAGRTEGGLPNAHNVNVTDVIPENRSIPLYVSSSTAHTTPAVLDQISGTFAYATHAWPHEFYLETIKASAPTCVSEYGFPLSREAAGDWSKHLIYTKGNAPMNLCGDPSFVQNAPVSRFDPPSNLQQLPYATGDSGASIIGSGFSLRTTTPQPIRPGPLSAQDVGPGSAWLAVGVPISNAVNFVQFDARFTSTNGAQGLMTAYWNTSQIGMVDERVASTGVESYRFALPGTVTNGLYTLSFRLDAFSNASSSITVTNVATGFFGIDSAITLNVTLTNDIPVLRLTGAPSYTYLVETSTNLLNWMPVALLSNATGTVLFPDTTATNSVTRFYRGLLP